MDYDLLSSYAGLLSLATLSIYAGSFGSLPALKRKGPKNADDSDDEDSDELPERLSSEDAWLFPVIGSATLLGLYGVIKYLGSHWLNKLLGWYFAVTGVASVWKSSVAFAKLVLGPERWRNFDNIKLRVQKGTSEITLSARLPSVLLLPVSIIPSLLYTFSVSSRKSVLVTDLLSLSFSYTALSLLKLDSFRTGCILLSGLFLYDIWWVFGTPVMVEVATKIDAPIKLLWPKSMLFSSQRGFTMLGLGDIVIPGLFVALALRFDFYQHQLQEEKKDRAAPTQGVPKPYFHASIIAYVSGLVATMTVMHTFQSAQPALLYLSPACILSFVFMASLRGELGQAWKWVDAADLDKCECEHRAAPGSETKS